MILTDEEISLMAHNADDGDWNDLNYQECWHNGFKAAAREVEAAIQAKLADQLKDAARLQWLLNDSDTNIGICLLSDGEYGEPRYMHKEEAIERIDAARRC